MKRTLLLLVLASCAIALISAQGYEKGQGPSGRPPRQQRQDQRPPQKLEDAIVSGNLTLVRGMIAVKKDDVTYFAGGLNRFIGFIDGLKEGAAVTLEGRARSFSQNENFKFLLVQKLTLNGKEYDLARPRQNVKPDQRNHRPMYQQRNHHGRWYAPHGHKQRMKNRNMHRGR
jgi:hypothetical protein